MSSEDIIKLIACIPALNDKYANLEMKHSALEDKYASLDNSYSHLSTKYAELDSKFSNLEVENSTLKNDIATVKSSSSKQLNSLAQYSRRNSFLAHRLRNVPMWLHGTEFTKWVAKELSRITPHLTLSHHDIDTSHFLYYEYEGRKRFPVVVVKFVCRDLRNEIMSKCGQDGYLGNSGVYLSEHLTNDNRQLFEDARQSYGEAWTEQCRIFVRSNGKKKEIINESDLCPQSNFVVVDDSANISDGPPTQGSDTVNSRNSRPAPPFRNRFYNKNHQYNKRSKHDKKKSDAGYPRSYSQATRNASSTPQWSGNNNNHGSHQINQFRPNSNSYNSNMMNGYNNHNTMNDGNYQMQASTPELNPHVQTPNHSNFNLPPASVNPEMRPHNSAAIPSQLHSYPFRNNNTNSHLVNSSNVRFVNNNPQFNNHAVGNVW